MVEKFYKYPRKIKTTHYVMERRVDGFHLVYMAKNKEGTELGSFEIDLCTNRFQERSGWREVSFSVVQEEVKQYLKDNSLM